MPAPSIDHLKVKELHDKGMKVTEIAEELGFTKGGISKALKKMNLAVANTAMVAAPQYEQKKRDATEHLMFLANKAKSELEWIESTVPPKKDEEYRKWQNQKLKFCAEMRKLINTMADIGYKLFLIDEVKEILLEIDEEIGRESKECQARIRSRLKRRRDLRFPINVA